MVSKSELIDEALFVYWPQINTLGKITIQLNGKRNRSCGAIFELQKPQLIQPWSLLK